MPGRVLVVINKWWEAEPVINALLHAKVGLAPAVWPATINHPRRRPLAGPLPPEDMCPRPRLVFARPQMSVEVWCISDLLEHLAEGRPQSSSERKAEQLPKVFASAPDLVIAVGTAAFPGALNGCVTIGTQIFMHNFHPGGTNPDSNWAGGVFDAVLPSALPQAEFARLTAFDAALPAKLMVTRNVPARPDVIAEYSGVSLGTINVTNAAEFAVADAATLAAFAASGSGARVLSLETTHAVIRSQSPAPFMFVSGIVNQVGQFDAEVRPNEYAQNLAGAHNAGVVVAALIALL